VVRLISQAQAAAAVDKQQVGRLGQAVLLVKRLALETQA
jgi:hypothetical protein